MPDHPHEGECKPEVDFTVVNPSTGVPTSIRTQNIAVSFVLAGNTSGTKDPTDAHCFPSIAVWDGRQANVGRIVIDSTWHHFVNINLWGFNASTYSIIEQYYMNIARWMTRYKLMLCWYRKWVIKGVFSDRVVEASMFRPNMKLNDISFAELNTIGNHILDVVAEASNRTEAIQFGLSLLEEKMPELADKINPWTPSKMESEMSDFTQWVNPEAIITIAIGAAVVKVKEIIGEINKPIDEKMEAKIEQAFDNGFDIGLEKGINCMQKGLTNWQKACTYPKK